MDKQALIEECKMVIAALTECGFAEGNQANIHRLALATLTAESPPVTWGAPKTVRQLIQQLKTLDPDLETVALLRMPANFRNGDAYRKIPISISFERLDGQWLAPYKGDGRKVLAFWSKPDQRDIGEHGESLTAPPEVRRPPKWTSITPETMPKDGSVVLVSDERGIIWCAEVDDGEIYPDEFPNRTDRGCYEATHWMLLPDAPSLTGAEGHTHD